MNSTLKNRIKIFSFLSVFALASFHVKAQEEKPLTLKSPSESIHSFLYYLSPENYNSKKSALSFEEAKSITEKERVVAAKKLKYILDGNGIFIDPEILPKSPNYYDSTLLKHIYFLAPEYPSFYVVKKNDIWVFPKKSHEKY